MCVFAEQLSWISINQSYLRLIDGCASSSLTTLRPDFSPGCRSRKQSEVFGWGRSRIFRPTPTAEVELDHLLHHTPKLGIPVEMAQFLLKLLLKQVSCCAPRFPLIFTAKFHSLYVTVSESEILERSESSDILPLTPQPWFLVTTSKWKIYRVDKALTHPIL